MRRHLGHRDMGQSISGWLTKAYVDEVLLLLLLLLLLAGTYTAPPDTRETARFGDRKRCDGWAQLGGANAGFRKGMDGWGRWRRWGERSGRYPLERERYLKHILGVAGVVRLVAAGLLSVRMGGRTV